MLSEHTRVPTRPLRPPSLANRALPLTAAKSVDPPYDGSSLFVISISCLPYWMRQTTGEGVSKHQADAHGHGEHGPHRLDEPRDRRHDAHAVEGEGQAQVPDRQAVAAAGELPSIDQRAETPADEHYVGRLHRDVGAGADGYAEVGLHERRGVVDAVSDHRHPVTLLLQV